nr:DIE2/ALG10 family [Tanacetum cinerariifolium]
MSPAPDPSTHDEPSVNNVHGSSLVTATDVPCKALLGISLRKSANICPLIDVLGLVLFIMFSSQSKEDLVTRISKSVFVTNFPDNFGPHDLSKLCEAYGKVVDVFIPNRKSKAGKRFAFVRFIRVSNVDRLIGSLCTLWVGRFHLHANAVRYERPSKPHNPVKNSLPLDKFKAGTYANNSLPSDKFKAGTYANVVKDIHAPPRHVTHSFNNPEVVLDDSCFVEHDLSCHVTGKVKELGSIQNLSSILAKEGFLEAATNDFISEERVVWVDIEGIPMHVWSRDTFLKIGKKWGEAMDIKESFDSSFARKRLCIKTNLAYNILETFKVIYKGKIFMARAKKLFSWTPQFRVYNQEEYVSDDEAPNGEPSLTHPSSFTPEVSIQEKNHDSIPQKENVTVPVASSECSMKVHSKDKNVAQSSVRRGIIDDLVAIDKSLDCGVVYDEMLLTRMKLSRKLYDIKQSESADFVQKSK